MFQVDEIKSMNLYKDGVLVMSLDVPQKPHDYSWAIKKLLNGERVRRQCWDKDSYLYITAKKIVCYDHVHNIHSNFVSYVSHIAANDWVLYE